MFLRAFLVGRESLFYFGRHKMLGGAIRRMRDDYRADVQAGRAQKTRRLGFQGDPSGAQKHFFVFRSAILVNDVALQTAHLVSVRLLGEGVVSLRTVDPSDRGS